MQPGLPILPQRRTFLAAIEATVATGLFRMRWSKPHTTSYIQLVNYLLHQA